MSEQLATSSVAVLGASPSRHRFSNKAVRALNKSAAAVYPVHPTASEIEGFPCYQSVSDIPVRPDILSIYLSPEKLMPLMDAIEEKGAGSYWLNPGADSPEIVREFMKRNLPFRQTCTIIEAGFSPADFSD